MAPVSARRLQDERGAELVEFAFVLPLLLLLVLGLVEFGFLFQRYLVVTNAAREGARVAMLPGYLDADVDVRVNQFLDASGLDEDPVIAHPAPPPIPIGGGRCITVKEVDVSYPYDYLFLDGIVHLFGGGGLVSTTVSARLTVRSEGPSLPCA
jgi:hypothetical protein